MFETLKVVSEDGNVLTIRKTLKFENGKSVSLSRSINALTLKYNKVGFTLDDFEKDIEMELYRECFKQAGVG